MCELIFIFPKFNKHLIVRISQKIRKKKQIAHISFYLFKISTLQNFFSDSLTESQLQKLNFNTLNYNFSNLLSLKEAHFHKEKKPTSKIQTTKLHPFLSSSNNLPQLNLLIATIPQLLNFKNPFKFHPRKLSLSPFIEQTTRSER